MQIQTVRVFTPITIVRDLVLGGIYKETFGTRSKQVGRFCVGFQILHTV